MSLWIDLDNSPHVLFFAPIIRNLEREGVDHFVTVRSFAQTVELAESYKLNFVTIGTHRARRFFLTRVAETAGRAAQLAAYVRRKGVTAAVSHNSRAMLLASWGLGIPAMTLYDYEFVFSRFSNRVSRKVVVPSEIRAESLIQQGLSPEKLIPYPGFKEEVYVYDFRPDTTVLSQLNLDSRRLIITLRPPQTWAHYHDHHSEVLLEALIRRLARDKDAQVMITCRTKEQAQMLKDKYELLRAEPFRLLTHAVDGLSLMWYSDAIFSGGGTMVREAALLGLDAYSFFASKLGAADAALERQGKLKMLRTVQEMENLEIRKRLEPPQLTRSDETRDFICKQIVDFARQNKSPNFENLKARRGPAPISEL